MRNAKQLLAFLEKGVVLLGDLQQLQNRRFLASLEEDLLDGTKSVRRKLRAGQLRPSHVVSFRKRRKFDQDALRLGGQLLAEIDVLCDEMQPHGRMRRLLGRFNGLRDALGVATAYAPEAALDMTKAYRRLHRQSHHILKASLTNSSLAPKLKKLSAKTGDLFSDCDFSKMDSMPAVSLWADVHTGQQSGLAGYVVLDIEDFSKGLDKHVNAVFAAAKGGEPKLADVIRAHHTYYGGKPPKFADGALPNYHDMRYKNRDHQTLAEIMEKLIAAAEVVDASG
jgi:hypothetical protein